MSKKNSEKWIRRLIVRLAVSFCLLIISVTTVLTFNAAQKESNLISSELKNQAIVLADNLAASVAAYIISKNYTSIEAILMRAIRFESILNLQVTDKKGKVLAHIFTTNNGKIESKYEATHLQTPKRGKQHITQSNQAIIIWQPVELGDTVGWVRVKYGLDRINETQKRIWYYNIQDGILLVILCFVMLIIILRKPLKSIENYTNFADTLNDYSGNTMPVDNSSLELNKLGTALNKASLNLHTQNTTLYKMMDQLKEVASIAEYSPDLILTINNECGIEYLNARSRGVLQELHLTEDDARKLLPHNLDSLRTEAFLHNKAISGIESTVKGRSFSWKLSPHSEQMVLHCHAIETTNQKLTEKALQHSEARYQTLFDSAADAILLISNNRFIEFNKHATILFACTTNDLSRVPITTVLPESQPGGRDSESTLHAYINIAKNGNPQSFEWQLKRLDGTIFDAEISLNVTQIDEESVILAIVRDITQRKVAEEKLIKQANYDTLTGLPNRVLVMDRLNQALKISRRQSNAVSVLFIDVDNFKTVNDTLGHSVGDDLIIEVAQRLQECVREGDTAARFGGDEFVIILNDLNAPIDAETVVEKILNSMNQPFNLAGQDFFLGASVGISNYPDDGNEATVLLRNADVAMYKAKEAGKNTFQFYAPEFNQQAKIRVQMEGLLRKALEYDEFFLVYQPQIDIQSGEIIGVEALIRWQNPELGLVQPDNFIKLAEDTGLIIPIGDWIIRTACQTAKDWQKSLGLKLRMSVNISQRQFSNSDLLTQVSRSLQETGLPPELLELELTESLLMDDSDTTLEIIHAFKQQGLTLALDDFGTGYSSLSYLKRFPFDVLKIDRAFVNDITKGIDEAGLCVAILAIASTFHMTVVAEGVENEEQLAFLHSSGADIAQGYFFSKGLPDEEFRAYIKQYEAERKIRLQSAENL